MLNKKRVSLNVETLVLVAVWENPYLFQGCITVKDLQENNTVLFFFRCLSHHQAQIDVLNSDFFSTDYQYTHLYNESGSIGLSGLDPVKEYALDMMKYALHITLREMLSSRKLHFTTIDDLAMQAMINKIKPILNQELALPEDDHIGFSVAMDFCPQEEMGHLAAAALLQKLENSDSSKANLISMSSPISS
jgi:hypothetical protein